MTSSSSPARDCGVWMMQIQTRKVDVGGFWSYCVERWKCTIVDTLESLWRACSGGGGVPVLDCLVIVLLKQRLITESVSIRVSYHGDEGFPALPFCAPPPITAV